MHTIGNQIALLRKQQNYTQEYLAELLGISPQAISKWENDHALPDTAILTQLAKALRCSVDNILSPRSLVILKAAFTDGFCSIDATNRVNKLADGDLLDIPVDEHVLAIGSYDQSHLWFLLVKFRDDTGTHYTYCKTGDSLVIGPGKPFRDAAKSMAVVDAYYGNSSFDSNVLNKIKHYDFFRHDRLRADAVHFPSYPGTDDKEFLTLIYVNESGMHLVSCEEGESLMLTNDRQDYLRIGDNEQTILRGVPMLSFGDGMDCSWAGAVTLAMNYLGEKVTYEDVMGLSGACYRLAFGHPVWDYSAADGLVAYDYSTPLYKALGYRQDFAGRVDKEDRGVERGKIIDSLKNNRPVIAINLRVAPEWGVITGFIDYGKRLLCRTYYDEQVFNEESAADDKVRRDDFRQTMETTGGYLFADNWPFLISYFPEKLSEPNARTNLLGSLRTFVDCVDREKSENGNYFTGYKAYEVWAKSLLDDISEGSMDAETFRRHQSVNYFLLQALVDARRCASEYLDKSAADYSDELKDELIEIASLFRTVYESANVVFLRLCDGYKDTSMPWSKKHRQEQSEMLLAAKNREQDAEKIARSIIRKLVDNTCDTTILEPKIINKGRITIAGVTGDGRRTHEIWSRFESLESPELKGNRIDSGGYELRMYDDAGNCECHVGVNVDHPIVGDELRNVELPEDVLYAVFEIHPAQGYESQNKAMNAWLEANRITYTQHIWNGREYAVEYYDGRFKGNTDPESIVEIWIPVTRIC